MENQTTLIKDFLITVFIIGLAFVIMAFLGTTEFGKKFQLITGEPFSTKIPYLVIFTAGCIGTYSFLYKIWVDKKEDRLNFYFLFGFSFLNIIGAILIIMWLNGVKDIALMEFNDLTFPTEVDLVAKNIRTNLISSVTYLLFTLMIVGLVSLVLGFYHLKTLNKD